MSNILVAGAGGFIGGHLVKRLIDDGHKIIAVDLPKKRALMHLDTIFTRISENDVLVFPPILDENFNEHLNKTYVFSNNSNEPKESNKDLISLLNEEDLNIQFIK